MNAIATVWESIASTSSWMSWNLFLALIPFVLSIWLFRLASTRSLFWWLGVLVFVAFLPNAPYILTDLIHLVQDIRVSDDSLLVNTLVVIPKYFLFLFIGFEAYVLSLMNVGHYLKRHKLASLIFQTELVLHGLSAIGVYLGRFERLNSWYIVTRPKHLVRSVAESLLDERPIIFMTVAFLVIAGLYWILKEVNLAVLLRQRYGDAIAKNSAREKSSE